MWRFFHFHGWVLRVMDKVWQGRKGTVQHNFAFQSIWSIPRRTQPNPLHKPQIPTFGHTTCSDLSSASKIQLFWAFKSLYCFDARTRTLEWTRANTEILQCLDPVRTTSSRRSDSKWASRIAYSTQHSVPSDFCMQLWDRISQRTTSAWGLEAALGCTELQFHLWMPHGRQLDDRCDPLSVSTSEAARFPELPPAMEKKIRHRIWGKRVNGGRLPRYDHSIQFMSFKLARMIVEEQFFRKTVDTWYISSCSGQWDFEICAAGGANTWAFFFQNLTGHGHFFLGGVKIRGQCDNVHHGFGTRRCFASAALDRSCFRWFHPNSTARINGPMMQRCLAVIVIYPEVGSYILQPYSHTDTPEMTLHLTMGPLQWQGFH